MFPISIKEILESFLFCMYLGSFTLPPLHKAKRVQLNGKTLQNLKKSLITGIVKLISMSAKNEISGHFREIFVFCGMTFFDVITIFVAKKARTEIDGEWCGYFYCDTNIKGRESY